LVTSKILEGKERKLLMTSQPKHADLDIIMITAKSQNKIMTKNDVIKLCGLAKNFGKNETQKGLRSISQFVRNKRHKT
jgi:hypothetical protein